MKTKRKTAKEIIEHGRNLNWSDSDIADALIYHEITESEIIECGYSDFLNKYYDECYFLNRISFTEYHYNEYDNISMVYFDAPIEILGGKYPEAKFASVRIDTWIDDDGNKATIAIVSPVKRDADGGLTSYDWHDASLTAKQIVILLKRAHNCLKKYMEV